MALVDDGASWARDQCASADLLFPSRERLRPCSVPDAVGGDEGRGQAVRNENLSAVRQISARRPYARLLRRVRVGRRRLHVPRRALRQVADAHFDASRCTTIREAPSLPSLPDRGRFWARATDCPGALQSACNRSTEHVPPESQPCPSRFPRCPEVESSL